MLRTHIGFALTPQCIYRGTSLEVPRYGRAAIETVQPYYRTDGQQAMLVYYWPVCAFRQKIKCSWFMGPWGQAPEQTSHFRLGAGKIQIRGNLVSANIWVWVLVGAANHTPY